jgi:hypothetical protein
MRKDRLSMYKESYNNELSRREKFGTELTIPIAMVTLLFGTISYAIGKIETTTSGVLLIVTLISLVVLTTFLIISVVRLVQSYYNFAYEYIASSKLMEEYYNALDEYYQNDENKASKIEDAFETYLINDYCKCNERNTGNNDQRSFYLHKARSAILVALIAGAITMGACNLDKIFIDTQNCINRVFTGKEANKNGFNIKSTGTTTTATTRTSATTTTTN